MTRVHTNHQHKYSDPTIQNRQLDNFNGLDISSLPILHLFVKDIWDCLYTGIFTGCPKKWYLWENSPKYLQTSPKSKGWGCFRKYIGYKMGTEIFKIEEEMTEKMPTPL